MRYFMVSLTLAAFYGLIFIETWRKRLALLAVAGVMAILSNWVRVYSLIVIGDLTEMQHYFVAESHDGFGWLVFVVCMLPVFAFARWLETPPTDAVPARSPVQLKLSAPYTFAVAAIAASLALAAPALVRSAGVSAHEPRAVDLRPTLPRGWTFVEASTEWRPRFAAPDLELELGLESPSGVEMDVFGASYASQRPGAKLLATSNSVHPEWQLMSSQTSRVSLSGDVSDVQQLQLSDGNDTRVVLYWYSVGGVRAESRVKAKLLELWALLRGRRDGTVVAVSAPCELACDTALAALTDYLGWAGQWTEGAAAGAHR